MTRDDALDILHRYRRGEIKTAEDAADLLGIAPAAPEKCHPCHGTGRYMGRYGHNDPDCPSCDGTGWADGQRRHPITGAIIARLRY